MPAWSVRFDLALDLVDPELVRLVARAEALASVIRGIPIPPYVRDRLDRLNIVRAVRGTTGIEGSDLSEEEVAEVLGAPDSSAVLPGARSREEQEVRNADRVMRLVSEWLENRPSLSLTESRIATIHRLTTEKIDYLNNEPGVYRSHPVRAGTYTPPADHAEVMRLMRDFIDWLNSPKTTSWPPVVKAVAAHFYLISIHPFGDGNGRTARAVESFLLKQAKINALGFYSLSNFYYKNRPEYVQALDDTRFQSRGNLTPFVRFSLEGLTAELELVHKEVLAAVLEIAFRDLANQSLLVDGKLGRKVGQRMYKLLLGLWDPVALRDIRSGAHPLAVLYRALTPKTLDRDVRYLKGRQLVVVSGGQVRANLDLMRQYMP